jgi:basic membrane lipoprotein Med (substrate-binding protein (PBP1-ABC) superfamily)
MISALDTHETVKSLTAAGFTDAHAEALTAAVKQAVDVDLSNIATKTDISDLRREMAEMKAELVKWVVGVGFAQVATILAVLKLFPAGHPCVLTRVWS